METNNLDRFHSKPINEQASVFLERYLWEFQNTYEEVLDVAEDFKRKAGEATTVSAAVFKEMVGGGDLAISRRTSGNKTSEAGASFVEICLALYGKTVADFFNPPAKSSVSPEDQARLKKAIEEYQKIQAEIAMRQMKIAELEAAVKAGGVKGMKAKAELAALKSADTTDQNRREIKGAAAQRSAQKAVSRGSQREAGGAEALKAKIAAAIAERMAKLQREEQERQAALAAVFAEQFVEPEEEAVGMLGSEVYEAEEIAQILSDQKEEPPAKDDLVEEMRRREEEEREKERLEREERERQERIAEAEARAEKQRLLELAEQEARLERERLEAEERALAAQREAEELDRRMAEAAAALEEAKKAHAANEEARRQKEEQIAALEREARLAAEAALEQQRKVEEQQAVVPIQNFSAWNEAGLSAAQLAELEKKSAAFVFQPVDWLNAFKLAKSQGREEVVKSLRRVVLNGTLQAIQQGRYELQTDGDPVSLNVDLNLVQESIAGAKMYAPDHKWEKSTLNVKGTAHFLQGDCVDVAVWLNTSRGMNPVVIVSVDPQGNGGAFEKGSCAQEEEIWRRTTLSAVAGATQFLPVSGSGCRYVPNVPILRQGENAGYAFSTQPITTAFITACALSQPSLQGMLQRYSDEDTSRMKQTIRAMFGAALVHGHDSIVIPAFGCGFNKCHPSVVAPLFHDILVTEYPKSFKHVTFAIINDENGPNNFEEFQKSYVARAKALAKIKADKAAKREAAAKK